MPEEIKTERLGRLNELVTAQMRDFGKSVIGRTLDVLIEKPGRMPGQIGGRSPYLQAVHIQADKSLIGSIVDTHITGVGTNSLSGHYANAA